MVEKIILRMDKVIIEKLHENLIESLVPFYGNLNFKREIDSSSFIRNGITIELYVNTKIGDYFTIRPGFSVLFKAVAEGINRVDKVKPICDSGYFYLDHKLANSLGVDSFDKCKENSMGSNQTYFLHRIENDREVKEVAKRHMEIMENFGMNAVEKCSSEQRFYDFLKNLASHFIASFRSYPDLPIVERPLRLSRASYLSLIWLSCGEDISKAVKWLEDFQSIFGSESSMIKDMKLIINTYESIYSDCEL